MEVQLIKENLDSDNNLVGQFYEVTDVTIDEANSVCENIESGQNEYIPVSDGYMAKTTIIRSALYPELFWIWVIVMRAFIHQ